MMNSPFLRRLAEKFAKRVQPSPDVTPDQIVEQCLCDGVVASADAMRKNNAWSRFLESQAASYGGDAQGNARAVADYCQLHVLPE